MSKPLQPPTENLFCVSATGPQLGRVVILMPCWAPMPPEVAMNLAAWLVAVADPDEVLFRPLFEAIKT